jgi:D-methionine transport system ATP-binding protein
MNQPMNQPRLSLLSVENLSLKSALDQLLLAPVSFELASGDRLAVIGATGAGKTTLLRLLARLQEPSSGQIFLNNQAIKTLSPLSLRRQIVLVPQEPRLLGLTVQETLFYPLKLQKCSPQAIAQRFAYWRSQMPFPDEWLDRNELQLSVGQRQWISILRGVMMEPQILLLDEPTSALDGDRAQQLITLLQQWTQNSPLAVIMVNHQREWVEKFSKRVITLTSNSETSCTGSDADFPQDLLD